MQWLYDGWGRLDWPNLVGGLVLGGMGWLLTWKVMIPIWNKSHETSKLLLHKRQKKAVLRDIRLIQKFKKGQHDIYLWCATKVIAVVLGCATMIGTTILMMSIMILGRFRDMGVPATFDIWTAPIPKDLENLMTYSMAFFMGIVTAVVMKHIYDVRRIVRYYTDMDDFKEEAKKILAVEDLKLLE